MSEGMNHWQGWLYVAAVLIPLGAFLVEILFQKALGRLTAYLATAAIATSCALSLVGFVSYAAQARGFLGGHGHHVEAEAGAEGHALAAEGDDTGRVGPHEGPLVWKGDWDWVALGGGLHVGAESPPPLAIPVGIYIDNLAVIMFVMVTFIATLIHIYSMGYMSEDPGYPRFFAYLSLFCFSMLGLVASSSIFMVFVCWELVGVCSYLLIGFWYEEKKNADAANKAFIVNRVGDVGMLIGLGLLWTHLGTFDIAAINRGLNDARLRDDLNFISRERAGDDVRVFIEAATAPAGTAAAEAAPEEHHIAYGLLVLAGLGIFAGCVGKSAQFPLHVWLPDAMAGPTPVSALIHAATMVAAGVYLVGRFFPLFTGEVLLTIGYTGGITLFIAASIAMVQTDYKKVLAYSTVSQLGFMMLALGVGGWSAGLFHLLTHAFFKALLFLCAGSIYHAVHTYEMPLLGGLYPKMKTTALTMLAGTMAISGVPFFSGFYSKDAILASALWFAQNYPAHLLLFVLPVVGAAMTAFYMFRLWFLVFAGTPRGAPAAERHGHDHGHDHAHGGTPADHAHESPPIMTWPLILLAICAVVVGYPIWILPVGEPILEQMLAYGAPLRAVEIGNAHYWAMGASLLIASVGIGLGVLYYSPWERWRRLDPARTAARFGPLHRFLVNKWYFDELYDALFVRPVLAVSRGVSGVDRSLIDRLLDGLARATAGLSRAEGIFDQIAVDRMVNLTGRATYALGDWGRGLQTGRLRNYLMVLTAGVVVLFGGLFYWIRG